MTQARPTAAPRPRPALWKRAIPWLITAACFAYLGYRLQGAAAREGTTLVPYLRAAFVAVDWWRWLALMIPYSILFFLIDSAVVTAVVNWFNARVRYADILPVRASTYILSILNEQVGKGAMALYLNRREGVPGWQLASSMLFIMVCEFYYLLLWANVGVALRWEALPPVFHALPWIGLAAIATFVALLLYARGVILPASPLRESHLFHAFRQASPLHYLGVVALRSPALLAAVFVYTQALHMFGVRIGYLDVLGFLPVIFFGAAVPGPFRAVAITLWVELLPENRAAMATFGLVQHNFFIFFNAAIGLFFLRRANREIFGSAPASLRPSA